MNAVHRDIIKGKRDILIQNMHLQKLEPFLIEYKMFNNYMWKDIKSVSDVFDALPSRGPKAFQSMIEILRNAGYNKEASILENPSPPSEIENKKLYYKMSSKPLGYCLIINNVNFELPKLTNPPGNEIERLEQRFGSDVDAESLKQFFESIDFVVTVQRNMKTRDMKDCIKQFSMQDFAVVDSMILIILSHGGQLNNKDFIYGTDGGFIFKEEIYENFDNKNCEYLQTKPKIFFFISCRGIGRDYGVAKNSPKESIDSISNITLPSCSDIYIVHSTLPYQVSIRNHEKGSYFCQALVSVLKEYYQRYDLETMIKLVNDDLQRKVSPEYRIVQMAHDESLGGTKKILLYRRN